MGERGGRWLLAGAFLGVIAVIEGAIAQPVGGTRFTGRGFDVRSLKTPTYRESTLIGRRRNEEWIQLVLRYETAGSEEGWADRLRLDWLAEVRTTAGKLFVLRQTVNYVDVRDGDHLAVVYIRPQFAARYNQGRRLSQRDVRVHVLATLEGVESGTFVYPAESEAARWWENEDESSTPLEGMLLARTETPFAPLDYDSLECIPPDR